MRGLYSGKSRAPSMWTEVRKGQFCGSVEIKEVGEQVTKVIERM